MPMRLPRRHYDDVNVLEQRRRLDDVTGRSISVPDKECCCAGMQPVEGGFDAGGDDETSKSRSLVQERSS